MGAMVMRSRGAGWWALALAVVVTAVVASPAHGQAAAGGSEQEDFPSFTRRPIADFRGGYQAFTADIDRDGRADIVALSTGSALMWFRNPDWQGYEIRTGASRLINATALDVNGDGRLDLALASAFNLNNSTAGGLVHWAEAPADPTSQLDWTLHAIDAVPTSHRLRWADIDGDGTRELVNLPIVGIGATRPAYAGAVQLKAYRIPADPTGTWTATVLDDALLEVAHGLEVVDWDGDAVDDLLVASSVGVSLFRPARRGQPDYIVRLGEGHEAEAPNRGASEVGLGTLGEGGRFIAALEPWHGNEVVVYTPAGDPARTPWDRRVIETEIEGGHALVVADLNGDGIDEIVAGGRSGGGTLYIYRYLPSSDEWRRIPLDVGGIATSSIEVTDLTGDGAPDILVIGSSAGGVVLYENGGSPATSAR